MRRAVSSVTVALALFGVAVAPAAAAAAPVSAATSGAASVLATPVGTVPLAGAVPLTGAVPLVGVAPLAVAGKKKCTITDERLRELSGLVATKTGYVVINDGTLQESRKRVFFLDTKCKIAREPVKFSGDGPFDTEDLALSPDGKTLWIADTGDNVTSRERRTRVAVWTMPVTGSKQPVLHRLSYPERKPHDAEALLIGADGSPLVITKVPSGKAEIFTPETKLDSGGNADPVPMKKVGEITLPKTTTDNPLNIIGRVAITGAARSPDGSRVVLRTYADAFEYDVKGDDIVAALTTGKPRVTPLADPFGEAISYTPDGTGFVTVSDGGELSPEDPIDILGYTPSTKGAEPVEGAAGAKPAADRSWYDNLSLDQITYLIGAVGVVGAVLVGAGIVGIVRSRRRAAAAGEMPDDPDDEVFTSGAVSRAEGFPAGESPPAAEPAPDRPRTGGVYGAAAGGGPARPAGGAVYGGGRPPAAAAAVPSGGPGGSSPAGGGRPAGGGVYGGGRPAGGGVYGATPAGGAGPRGATPAGGAGPRGATPAGGAGPRGATPAGGAGPRGGADGAGPRGGAPGIGPRGGASGGGARGGAPAAADPRGGAPAGGRGGMPAGGRGGAPAGGRGGVPADGRGGPPGIRGGAPVAGRGTPPGGRGGPPPEGRGGAPVGARGGPPPGGRGGPPPGGRAAPPAGGRGGAPVGGPGAPPAGGRGGAPAGGRGAGPAGGRGGAAGGGDGVYGAGRAEPPRREGGPREPRSGPRRDDDHDDRRGGQYGPPPGRSGERY
ncbi:hypothetical protein J7462_28200 [Micromonospora sp. RL09-050-HVF-A]|nr:hypothetical protein [Micromonospora sp. RL09-050-HVF-A]